MIGPQNDKEKINDLVNFGDKILGKTVVVCNDSPGFLGNRVGVYAMQVAMTEAFNLGLTVEEADAVFGRPLGIPKTGIFGLYDLIGIDLMADVLKSFIKELPISDPFHIVGKELPIINQLIENGYTGRKGKGGFFRMNKTSLVLIIFLFWTLRSYGTNIFVLVSFYINEFFFNLKLIIDDLAKIIYQIIN